MNGPPTTEPVCDCDVHIASPPPKALYPYLSEHWRQYMEATHFRPSPAIVNAYPAWSEMLATPAVSLERVQQEVLERATVALVHCYSGVESYTHPYLAGALATAVNQWLADEWLGRDDRLLAGATLAPQHLTQSLDEIERVAADPRFVQLTIPARSSDPYGEERFWPVWEAAAQAGLVIGIHSGGAVMHPQTMVGYVHTAYDAYANAPNNLHGQIVSLIFSGIFQRCPQLRFSVMESGVTWLPALMWKMDQEWKAFRREVPWLDRAPSEYVRTHFRFTTAPIDAPPTAAELSVILEQIGGGELLMYSTDFPHRYRDDGMEGLLAALSDQDRHRVRWSNACELYGLQDRAGAASATA